MDSGHSALIERGILVTPRGMHAMNYAPHSGDFLVETQALKSGNWTDRAAGRCRKFQRPRRCSRRATGHRHLASEHCPTAAATPAVLLACAATADWTQSQRILPTLHPSA